MELSEVHLVIGERAPGCQMGAINSARWLTQLRGLKWAVPFLDNYCIGRNTVKHWLQQLAWVYIWNSKEAEEWRTETTWDAIVLGFYTSNDATQTFNKDRVPHYHLGAHMVKTLVLLGNHISSYISLQPQISFTKYLYAGNMQQF